MKRFIENSEKNIQYYDLKYKIQYNFKCNQINILFIFEIKSKQQYYTFTFPPSTGNKTPLMKLALSLAKNKIAFVVSETTPVRPTG